MVRVKVKPVTACYDELVTCQIWSAVIFPKSCRFLCEGLYCKKSMWFLLFSFGFLLKMLQCLSLNEDCMGIAVSEQCMIEA